VAAKSFAIETTYEFKHFQNHDGKYEMLNIHLTRFEDFTAIKIRVVVFWVVTPCNDVGG
jgi:hypothetical protein